MRKLNHHFKVDIFLLSQGRQTEYSELFEDFSDAGSAKKIK